MNYDRTLMEKVGGQLIVLETQANSGKDQQLIRKAGEDVRTYPAHKTTKLLLTLRDTYVRWHCCPQRMTTIIPIVG